MPRAKGGPKRVRGVTPNNRTKETSTVDYPGVAYVYKSKRGYGWQKVRKGKNLWVSGTRMGSIFTVRSAGRGG